MLLKPLYPIFAASLVAPAANLACLGPETSLEELGSGAHCLNEQGHSDSFSRDIEKRLINPDSFEPVETRIEPVSESTITVPDGRILTVQSTSGWFPTSKWSGFSESDSNPLVLSNEDLKSIPDEELKHHGYWIQMDYKGTNKFDAVLRKTARGHLQHEGCTAKFFGVD